MGRALGVLKHNVKSLYKFQTFFLIEKSILFLNTETPLECMLSEIQNLLPLEDIKKLFLLVQGRSRFRRPTPGGCRDMRRNE